MPPEAQNVDRIEAAANITLTVTLPAGPDTDAQTIEVPISRLDATKDIEISQLRQSSLKANGYAITSIEFSGSMMFAGYRVSGPDRGGSTTLDDILTDDEGVPLPVTVTITHDLDGASDTYEDVLITSDSYEVRSEEETETAFDWVAMDKS